MSDLDGKTYLIGLRHQFKVVSMLHNWNLINSSHYRIFKCIGFVPSHYVNTINLVTTTSFSVFSEFNFASQISIRCIDSLNQ